MYIVFVFIFILHIYKSSSDYPGPVGSVRDFNFLHSYLDLMSMYQHNGKVRLIMLIINFR